jgi:hypothetical protein
MSRLLTILLACIALAGCAVGLVLVLGGGSAGKPAAQSAAARALLQRGGGPDGSAAVTLTHWRYRADPRNRGLNAGWKDGRWTGREVTVPHSPNARAHSGAAGRRAYNGSVGWYAREIDAPVGGHYALHFESAHYRAQVYVDGELLRRHTGAYEPFSARPLLRAGRHTVAVRVDWRNPERQADEDWQRSWFNYGGLQRPVTLTRLGPSQLGALHVRTRLRGGDRARVDVSVRVRNRGDTRRLALTGALSRDGVAHPLRFGRAITLGRGSSRTVRASVLLDSPDLWSPASPDRYELRVAVPGEATIERMVGLRELTWDSDGLYVNGDLLVLRGAALPADARGHGDAMTAGDEAELVADLRKIGANATRSQLPLAQSMLERLDAAGIFVWQEIGPWEPAGKWRAITPAAIDEARDRALRAAEESQAHASVLAWTLTNEAPGQGHPGQQEYAARTAQRLQGGRWPPTCGGRSCRAPTGGSTSSSTRSASRTTSAGTKVPRPRAASGRSRRNASPSCARCSPTSRSSSPSSARSAAHACRPTPSAASGSKRACSRAASASSAASRASAARSYGRCATTPCDRTSSAGRSPSADPSCT